MTPEEAIEILNIDQIRNDFPILDREIEGKPLVYLDNAATSQKPQVVIDAIVDYYSRYNANIHRGVHRLAQEATDAFEKARRKIQHHFNARHPEEIIFTSGTTHALNLIANGFTHFLKKGDEILVSTLEHHSNIVPWQMLCERQGAKLRVVPITETGELVMDDYHQLLTERTKLVSLIQVSNAMGTINPVAEMVQAAHDKGIPVLLDGAQAVPHLGVDVQALDCDFYAFSGHKMYGPSGVGVLYGKAELLEAMPPYQGGGDMIRLVTFEKTEYADLPNKFEAGTPNIAGVIGLGAAADWIEQVGIDAIAAHEQHLLDYATAQLSEVPGLRIIGSASHKAAVVSFVMEGVHPHDIGTILDREGVAIRAGHHCAQPLMQRYGLPATARASFAVYNTHEEVDKLAAAIHKVKELFD